MPFPAFLQPLDSNLPKVVHKQLRIYNPLMETRIVCSTSLTSAQIAIRNDLLENSLRPDPQPFRIVSEYPLVLRNSPEALATSYCVMVEREIVGHINILPRIYSTTHGKTFPIALIGNVAIAEAWRGKGISRALFNNVNKYLKEHNLCLAILWSDLFEFYQKIGFASLGSEKRLSVLYQTILEASQNKSMLPHVKQSSPKIHTTTWNSQKLACQLEPAQRAKFWQRLLDLREYTSGRINRSTEEFHELAQIPAMTITLCSTTEVAANKVPRPEDVIGFGFCGKGADLSGVIHEWGVLETSAMIDIAQSAMNYLRCDELMILTPGATAADKLATLSHLAFKVEDHPMGLGMKNPQHSAATDAWNAVSQGFLWGLDSI